jgi:hypothetical protein
MNTFPSEFAGGQHLPPPSVPAEKEFHARNSTEFRAERIFLKFPPASNQSATEFERCH